MSSIRIHRSAVYIAGTAILLVVLLAVALIPRPATAQSSVTFRATITNTTNPEMIITPGAFVVHTTPDVFWALGDPASLALERIAEIGNPAEAVSSLGATALDAAPANGASVSFQFAASPGDSLSFAQMLIATNDAFIGLNSLPLWEGSRPISVTRNLVAYDAGTEANEPLFSGFDGGQPDPSRGMANVDNGMATADSIGAQDQLSGTQATISIAPVVAALPATGSGGLADAGGGLDAWALAALAALGAVLLGATLQLIVRRR